MVEFFGCRPRTSCWHVLWGGDVVGYVSLGVSGWGFSEYGRMIETLPPEALAEITAAVKEKMTLLNITQRLTS